MFLLRFGGYLYVCLAEIVTPQDVLCYPAYVDTMGIDVQRDKSHPQ